MPIARPAVARIAPFSVFIAFIAFDGVLTSIAHTVGLDPSWWYGIRVVSVAGLLAWFWKSYDELRSTPTVRALDWGLASLVGVVVFILWINLAFPPLSFGQSRGYDARTAQGTIDWGFALIRLGGAALVVPPMEELFWRSFIMRWIQSGAFLSVDPKTVGLKAIVISSALFALEHDLWLAGLLAGLGYALLYRRTGNLWTAVLAHAITNGLLGCWIIETGSWELW